MAHATSGSERDNALLAALTVAQEYQSDADIDPRAQLLEQALWGEDEDEDDGDGDRGGESSDGMLIELLASDELPDTASSSIHAHHVHTDSLEESMETHTSQQFQPMQVAALPNRRNLARRSRTKLFKYKPNKARDGRREELLYLNQKVSELETQLATLQRRHRLSGDVKPLQLEAGASASIRTDSGAIVAAPQRSLAMSVWRDIASRQSDERVKAERENIRLKLVLEHQIKIAKSLEGILHKKLVTKDIEKCVQGGRLRQVSSSTTDSATDEMLFAELLAGVEQSYAEVDAVLASSHLGESESCASDAQVRSDGAGGMFLEFFANKVIPFDVHTTGAAVWQHFVVAKERMPYRFYSNRSNKSVDATEDTVIENFNLELHANSTRCSFRVKQVLRRYTEDARVVLVWRAVVDPTEFSDEPVSGVRFHEKGYIVVRRPPMLTDPSFALLQQCTVSTPLFTDGLMRGDHPKVGALTDFVLSSIAANISASRQMIENVLLEQAMRSGSGFAATAAPPPLLPNGVELLDV